MALATVHQEMSRLRRCLGAEHFAEAKSGYQLAETVECDWARFEALTEAARAVPEDKSIELLREALSLVRGQPFQDVAPKTYTWAFDEVLVARMEAAVAKAGHLMCARCLAAGRHQDAAWAVRQALLAGPTDEMVREDELELAAATGGPSGLERAWREAQQALGPQPEGSPLTAAYRRLRTAAQARLPVRRGRG